VAFFPALVVKIFNSRLLTKSLFKLAFTKPPYTCKNEGWGEFELTIDCYYTEKSKISVPHDLNFQKNEYEVVRSVSFKNPSQALQEKLRELGPLPTDDDRPKKKGIASKKSSSQKYDYEKIADAMEKLEEDDLLKVIQIINDYKNADTYIKSDIEGKFQVPQFVPEPFLAVMPLSTCGRDAQSRPFAVLPVLFPMLTIPILILQISILIVDDLTEAGEFSIDLYTMPDILTKTLWDHLVS